LEENFNELLNVCNLVGYGEIKEPYHYTSTLRSSYKKIDNPRLTEVTIKDKSGVYPALKKLFTPAHDQMPA